MTDCERNQMTLSSWLDGELDPWPEAEPEIEPRIELLDHLTRCAECRTFYLQARALDGLAAGLRPGAAEPAPRPEVWERIRRAVPARAVPVRRAIPAWALRAAALVVLGLGLAFALWQTSATPESEPPRIEVLADESARDMSEARFVELASEVLRADRRYQRAMLQVMSEVLEDDVGLEASPNELLPRDEDGAGAETAGETATRGRA